MPSRIAKGRRQPPELEGMWCNDGGCTKPAMTRCARCQNVFCVEHESDHLDEGAGCWPPDLDPGY